MSVRIRLARGGTKKRPFYRIVATNPREPARRPVPGEARHLQPDPAERQPSAWCCARSACAIGSASAPSRATGWRASSTRPASRRTRPAGGAPASGPRRSRLRRPRLKPSRCGPGCRECAGGESAAEDEPKDQPPLPPRRSRGAVKLAAASQPPATRRSAPARGSRGTKQARGQRTRDGAELAVMASEHRSRLGVRRRGGGPRTACAARSSCAASPNAQKTSPPTARSSIATASGCSSCR